MSEVRPTRYELLAQAFGTTAEEQRTRARRKRSFFARKAKAMMPEPPPKPPRNKPWIFVDEAGTHHVVSSLDEAACGETFDGKPCGWMCTLMPGHAGDHMAVCDAQDKGTPDYQPASCEARWPTKRSA